MSREVLFNLTQLSTAARFFKGELKVESLASSIYTLPSYWGVVLNPALSDYDPPYPPLEHPLYQSEMIFDSEGNFVKLEPKYAQVDGSLTPIDSLSEDEICTWWGYIRKELIDESPVFPRINAMRVRYKKDIEEFEAMWWKHNSD